MVSPETPKSGKRKRAVSNDVNSPRSRNKAVKSSSLKICEADEIIEVDDTDTPPAKPVRALRSATVLTDYSKVCEFPEGTKDTVSVCLADYKTLQHDTFLNDIIIDFYLTYLFHKFLNEEDRPTVHMFSTMFYKRLNSTPKKASTVASYEKDSSLKPAEKRHMRVKGWTKNVNLFEKNMVIIPICEHSHWYLVIAIRPGLITIPMGSEERHTKGEPFMIVLDSMGGNKTTAVSNIRHYLSAEWKAKMCGEEGDEDEYEFTSKEMRTVRPQKPEQENYSDCGIYLLHYIEMMFKSVAQYYWPGSIQDLNNWFTTEEISTKRDEIARLIRDLSADQNMDKEMKFPDDIPFLPPVAVTRSKTRREEFEHESSEEEEDDWGRGQVLGGSSGGMAAAGFYGERSGVARNLRNGDSSSSVVGSGDSDVSSYTASEVAREQRHRNREQRSKETAPPSQAASAKSVKGDTVKESDKSRLALGEKLKQIKGATTAFDEVRKYKIPKSVKPQVPYFQKDSVINDEGQTARKQSRRPSGESVIVVDNNAASSQVKSFKTSVIPSERSPRKSEKSRQTYPAVRNSIVNSIQIKSRADLHKEMNCVAELEKMEAELEEEEEEHPKVVRRTKNAAMKAFRDDQKAIHESIVNEVSRIASPSLESHSQKNFSKSLPIPTKKKGKSSPEKRKVLQNKVLEDLLELEEEGNTEDEEEEVTEKVKVLQIEDEPEPEIKIRKVKIPKPKEAFRSIITEKVKISRDGKELSKVTPEPEIISHREITPKFEDAPIGEMEEYVESPMHSPDVMTVDDIAEITTVEDTPDSSEVTTIDDPTPDLVVSIEDDFPLVGFLEKVEVAPPPPVCPLDPVIQEPVRSRKSTSEPSDLLTVRKSTSEPESPKGKSKATSEPESPLPKKKSTSEPDSPKHQRTLSKPNRPHFKANSSEQQTLMARKKSTSEQASPKHMRKLPKPNSPQYKAKSSEPELLIAKKKFTSEEPLNHLRTQPIQNPPPFKDKSSAVGIVRQKSVTEPGFPSLVVGSLSKSNVPLSYSMTDLVTPVNFDTKLKSEPQVVIDLDIKSTSEPFSSTFESKSTSEPLSPVALGVKSTSEPRSPIFSRKKASTGHSDSVVLKKQKAKTLPKIQIDSDSDDAGNSSGSECNFALPKGKAISNQRPKRERKFSSLSEIERAKLKNIPTNERLEILAKRDKKVKPKASDRNALSRDNPFSTSPRGAKSVQQQRGSKSRSSTASDASEVDGHFQTDSAIREVPIQIDYNSSDKVATTSRKKFKLQNHGTLSPHDLKISNVRSTNNFHKFAEETFVSDSGSDTTDIYTTDDL